MGKPSRGSLVAQTATHMRDMILAQEPGTQIGSLPELAKSIGVGIVTVQQAARVLEHEGFLKVRRGNGGGFYAARPDAATLGRAIAGFLQINRTHEREALEIMTLLDCDLIPAASLATDEHLRSRLRDHAQRIDSCETADDRRDFENEMQDIIYRMVNRPLMEMLARMTMQHYASGTSLPVYSGDEGTERWKKERHAIVEAILKRDPGLARFEAQRRHDDILNRAGRAGSAAISTDQTG